MLSRLKNKFISRLFARFVTGGIASFVFNILITYIFTEFFSFNYFIVYLSAVTITTLFNFVVAIKYIFRITENYHIIFCKYTLFVIVFYFANLLGVKFLTDYLAINYLISITLVTAVLFLAKFIIYDKYVFHR